MDISRIEDPKAALRPGLASLQQVRRSCIYYKEESCLAPRIRFQLCRGCARINLRFAVSNLFNKIKEFAASLMGI